MTEEEILNENKELSKKVEYLATALEKIENEIVLIRKRQMRYRDEIHKHIDFAYRDLMIVLEKQKSFIGENDLELVTEHPIALDSLDHQYPTGTANDNTRYPRFIKKCESIFEKKQLCFMDLGCSGGGMVLDAILRNHFAIGVEGSDYSLTRLRAEWRLLENNLYTCDITKPFEIKNKEKKTASFDVITAWEVLEHIKEKDLEQLFENIKKHMDVNGIFVASICSRSSKLSKNGIELHVTIKPKEWWNDKFNQYGFYDVSSLFDIEDIPRGGINNSKVYLKEGNISDIDLESNFFFALRKKS